MSLLLLLYDCLYVLCDETRRDFYCFVLIDFIEIEARFEYSTTGTTRLFVVCYFLLYCVLCAVCRVIENNNEGTGGTIHPGTVTTNDSSVCM